MKPREWWIDVERGHKYIFSQPTLYDMKTGEATTVHVIEKSAYDREHYRLNYVMECLEDWIDEIECRGDEDCDHCVVKFMIQDQKEPVGGTHHE